MLKLHCHILLLTSALFTYHKYILLLIHISYLINISYLITESGLSRRPLPQEVWFGGSAEQEAPPPMTEVMKGLGH